MKLLKFVYAIYFTAFFTGCVDLAVVAGIVLDGPSEPKPKIRSGEFPFVLTYEVYGERREVIASVVCSYAGRRMDASGIWNDWKEGVDDDSLELSEKNRAALVLKKISSTELICIDLGSCDSYMDDLPSWQDKVDKVGGSVWYQSTKNGTFRMSRLGEEELLNEFGIRIISWKPAIPIENSNKSVFTTP